MERRTFVISAIGLSVGLAGCSAIPGGGPEPEPEQSGGSDATDAGGDSSQDVTGEQSGSKEGQTDESASDETTSGSETTTEEETVTVELNENEPTAVVETFYDALYAPDVQTANDLLHPESPETRYSREAVARFEGTSHQLEGMEVTEQNGGTAVVEFVLVLVDSEGRETRTQMAVELRLDGEDWKIWEAK